MDLPDPFAIRMLGARRRGALDGITLDVQAGEFLAILGPRGAGKTALLRVLAGHEAIDEGVLYLAGRDVTHAPAHQRPANLVGRGTALFPHLTVAANVAFGLRYTPLAASEQAARVQGVLEILGLAPLAGSFPRDLTADQAQRVALARALVLPNPVLLLDEALGELDLPGRHEVAAHLKHLQQRTGLTVLLATRDCAQAMSLADRIVVLHQGRIEQIGPAEEVFQRPRSPIVANVVGASNFLGARVTATDRAILTVGSPAGFETVLLGNGRPRGQGDAVRFLVRPERLVMRRAEPEAGQALAYMEVTLEERRFQGDATLWIVRNRAGERLLVRQAAPDQEFVIMGKAWVCWDPRDAVLIEE